MKEKIKSIEMNGKLSLEEIYNLFKTHSSKTNIKIFENISNFQYNIDFFEFYSNKDIKNLLNIFELEIPKNNEEFFSSFKSDIQQYISCISQIILTIKLFLKTHDILKKLATNAKNHLSKLKHKKKIENFNQNYLFLYLDSLFKISEKNNTTYSNHSTLLSSNMSANEDTINNPFFPKKYNEYENDGFSIDEKELNIYDNQKTPRFGSESDDEFKNNEKKNSYLNELDENISPIKKDSELTLSNYVFAEEQFIPQNHESKLIEPYIVEQKIKNCLTKGRMLQNENFDKYKNNRKKSFETDLINKNKNHYKNLLEMISNMYKTELINSEEKLKLKQLVIEKSKKIEHLYYNIYKNSINDKNSLVNEVKKIIN